MLFDDAELIAAAEPLVRSVATNSASRERYRFQKTKRLGDCWEERPVDPGGGSKNVRDVCPGTALGSKRALFVVF